MAEVDVTRHGAVTVLTLNRPHRRNAFGGRMFAELLAAAEAADRDEESRAIVTTGAGASFGVGADLAELERLVANGPVDLGEVGVDGIGGQKGLPPQSSAQKQADHLGIGRWAQRFRDIGLPTIAAINGAAAGGAMALTLLHDVRIASADAKLATSFISLGLGPELGLSWLLTRLVGEARAFDLLTRTRPICAEEALAIGLVESVVEPQHLVEAAINRAHELAALPPVALRATKRLVHSAGESSFAEQLEREWMSQRILFSGSESRQLISRALAGRNA